MRFLDAVKQIFNPKHIYTLDYNAIDNDTEIYTFKEYGTHSYVKKSYRQILETNFIYLINPKDILYISKLEEKKAMFDDVYFIHEERRKGVYKLSNATDTLLLSGKEVIKNRELIDKIDNNDVAKIAYLTGVHAGRKISEMLSQKTPLKKKTDKSFKIIK
ncbi:hypothetical protein [Sodalis glossinidius]|nr:hypothetical protein [Sodalis glossinidius]